jgi:hypothetical protein
MSPAFPSGVPVTTNPKSTSCWSHLRATTRESRSASLSPPTLTERPNRQISDLKFTLPARRNRLAARGKWLQKLVTRESRSAYLSPSVLPAGANSALLSLTVRATQEGSCATETLSSSESDGIDFRFPGISLETCQKLIYDPSCVGSTRSHRPTATVHARLFGGLFKSQFPRFSGHFSVKS